MDDLLVRIKGMLLTRQMCGENNSDLIADIDKRLEEQDEKLATIRCLKCGHSTSITITMGKLKPSPTPRHLYEIDGPPTGLPKPIDYLPSPSKDKPKS